MARHSDLFKAMEWLRQQDTRHAATLFREIRRLNIGRDNILQKPTWKTP